MPRVERADDQLAARVELHVLVLPVAVRGQLGRQVGVERLAGPPGRSRRTS